MDMKKTSEMPPMMDISEFRRLGYVQEINRLFLHPLGLALAVDVNDDGTETLAGVVDNRDDPEGWYFLELNEGHAARAKALADECARRSPDRMKALGYIIQPLEP